MKIIINYKSMLIWVQNCLLTILFSVSAVVVHAQTETVYSPVSLSSNNVSLEDMVRLDYESLFYLDVDPEQGIMGTINSEGGRIDVKVYAYDANKSNGMGIEIYSTYITESSSDSYAQGHTTKKNILEYDPSGTSDSGYITSPFLVDSNDIKRRAQDAKINNAPAECEGKSSWTDLFFPDEGNSCVEDYVAEVQPVIVEITTIGGATFLDAKIPGIGVMLEKNNRVVRSSDNPLNGFAYCESKRHWYWHVSSDFCRLYERMKTPDISSTDFIIAAHRGWWGYNMGDGPPENTKDAVDKAHGQDIRFIEMDLTISSDNKLLFMHDYVMKRLTNYTGDDFSFDLPWSTMKNYKVKKRNGDVSKLPLSQFYEVVDEVKHHGMIMMVDIKEKISNGTGDKCIANCDYQDKEKQKQSWANIAKRAIREAQGRNVGMNLVFKTYFPYEEVKRLIGDDRLMNSVLWVPMLVPNNFKDPKLPKGRPDVNLMVDFIDGWNTTEAAGLVTYFETNFFKADDVMLQRFSVKERDYTNLLDYIYVTTDRRAGVFSEEPVGPKGTVNRWGKWKIKNPNNDIRGDFFKILDIPYGKNMVITSDRLDVWKKLEHTHRKHHAGL